MSTKVKRSSPWGYSIFCDDIREELHGKVTLVGVYNDDMILHSNAPANLARLGIVVSYFERPAEVNEDVQIQVFMPGDPDDQPAIKMDVPTEQMRGLPVPTDIDDPMVGFKANLMLSPVRINSLGRIRVRAIRGDKEVSLGGLKITHRPADPSPSASEQPSEQSPPGAPAS